MIHKQVDLIVVVKSDKQAAADDLGSNNYLDVNEYLGVGYIKSYLEHNGIGCNIRLLYNNELEKLPRMFAEEPFLAGFCVYIDIAEDVFRAARALKEAFPKTHITLGGPQVTGYSEQILSDNPFIDSVIEGEGEITLHSLWGLLNENRPLSSCEGLTFRDEAGQAQKNMQRKRIADLDDLPYPSRYIYEKVRQEYMYISGGRGCLGFCAFCGESAEKKNMRPEDFVRIRHAKNIVDEMEHYIAKYDIRSFRFTDATFEDPYTEGEIKAEGIFDEIIKRGLQVSLHTFSRAELVTDERRDYLRKGYNAGLECVYLGVESGNGADLKLYNKKAGFQDNIRAIRLIREAGIHAAFGFICFNPYSTYESLLNNANFLYESGLGHVFYLYQTRLEVLPQAPIRKKMIKDGLLDPMADYRTSYYDYHFQNPRIGELFEVIKHAYAKTPIYYMDTLIGMYRCWINRNLPDNGRNEGFHKIFGELDEINMKLTGQNHKLFTQCITMCRQGDSIARIKSFCQNNPIDLHHERFLSLYMKIRVKVGKERFKKLMGGKK